MGSLIIFFVVYATLSMLGFWWIARTSGRIHNRLNKLKQQAEAAKNTAELSEVETALIEYHDKECWHRAFGDHAREVRAYIQGKKQSVSS